LAFGRVEIKNAEYEHVEDEYVIAYYSNTTHEIAAQHWDLMESVGVAIKSKYSAGSFTGFCAKITDKKVLAALQEDPLVEFIAVNGFAYALQTCDSTPQNGATWGISRTCHQGTISNGLSTTYIYSNSNNGAGVSVYVLDTGIMTTHTDFGGRAKFGASMTGENTDGNGHGTHCAGTIGGTTWGIAKAATLVAVNVLTAAGSGTWDQVIRGVNWVTNNGVPGASVVSMSLGGTGSYDPLTAAINALVNEGIPCIVAAGNNNANACGYTPAGIPSVISVGATANRGPGGTEVDTRSSFSNYGTCVKIFAPGTDITSTWIGSNVATRMISGTSMACPHVAGVAAGLLSNDRTLSPEDIRQQLQSTAQRDLIQSPGTGSPNLLLWNGCNSK
jgi:cerevisin